MPTATRRDFLRVGTLATSAAGLSLTDVRAARPAQERSCILLFLVGGPSQLDTWDPKPDAPAEVRGPFRPIQTAVPGMRITELFPLMAGMANRYAIIRSVHHDASPIHETGQQLMQTGHLSRADLDYPHYGAVVSHLRGPGKGGAAPWVILPSPIGNTGININHGQGPGYLGTRHQPLILGRTLSAKRDGICERYGKNSFGQACLTARCLVERGVRLVTVNMFDTVFGRLTWDCHADGGALGTTLNDYRDTVCPMFDRAYATLLDDLHQRGMLESTLVAAMGEFGRTPRLNAQGGRDHWPSAWSVLFAGAGVRGGQVLGASDRLGAEPRERPVTPAEVAATVFKALELDLQTRLPGPAGQMLPLTTSQPLHELFGCTPVEISHGI